MRVEVRGYTRPEKQHKKIATVTRFPTGAAVEGSAANFPSVLTGRNGSVADQSSQSKAMAQWGEGTSPGSDTHCVLL